MGFADCFKSAGLDPEEARIYNDLVEKHQAEGMSPEEAQRAAIDSRLDELAQDKSDVLAKIYKAAEKDEFAEAIERRAIPSEEPRERRVSSKARELYESMSREELISQILKHELTGIKGRKAFVVDVQEAPIVASIDADSLKWINDNLSPDHGDALLQAVADALEAETDMAYHISGDEFYVLGDAQADVQSIIDKAIDKLSKAVITATKPDGKTITLNGLNITYGIGENKNAADQLLKKEKVKREETGERAPRGEQPLGSIIRPAEGVEIEDRVSEVEFDPADPRILFQGDISAQDDYKGEHQAPGPDDASLHDVTKGGDIYPDDIYSADGLRYYGTGQDKADRESMSVIQSVRNSPDARVKIYRAVPHTKTSAETLDHLDREMAAYLKRNTLPDGISDGAAWYDNAWETREELREMEDENAPPPIKINTGDWVTLSRSYAKEHGGSALNGEYKIVSKTVKAKELFTNGDSINEFGYWEDGKRFEQRMPDGDIPRASIQFTEANESIIRLSRAADLSSFLHESAHLFLEMESRFADKFGQSDEQNVLLKWLGVESFDQIGTEQHEKFAETFEVYLREGKAPSLKLRDAFAAFARWLTVIYRQLTDPRLGRADLSPEIREYMDRMLATESELQQAEANPAYDELFRSKEQAGMADEEWEKYQKQREKVRSKATIDLNQKVINEYKKRKTKQWNSEKKPLIEEEKDRLSEEPVYQVLDAAANEPMDYRILIDAISFDVTDDMSVIDFFDTLARADVDDNIYDLIQSNDPIDVRAAIKQLNKQRKEADKSKPLDLMRTIATKGGIDRTVAIEEGIDKDHFRDRMQVFGKPLFPKKGGNTIDELTEILGDYGFVNEKGDRLSSNEMLDMVLRGLQGEEIFTASDAEINIERETTLENIDIQISMAEERLVELSADKELVGVSVSKVSRTARLMGKLIGKVKKDGVDPAQYAEAFGFSSVSSMLNTIEQSPTLNQAAEEAAQQRMLDKYGDMLNDGRIELEAREAMHNEEQAELLIMELNALNKKAPQIDRKYLKAESKHIIESMTYKEMRPHKYYMAEIRAAQKAATVESVEDKIKFKTQQIVNHYLYREAINARESMTKYRKFIRGVQTREYKASNVTPDYSQNMRILANMYDLKNKQAQTLDLMSVLEWYEAQVSDENQYVNLMMMDENLLLAMEAKREGRLRAFSLPKFDDMTFSQLKSVRDMLRHMRYVGGQFANGVDMEVKAERSRLIESVLDKGGKDVDITRGIPTKHERLKRQIQHAVNKLPSLRNLIRKLDGFDETGPAYELIYQVVEQANNGKLDLARKMYDRFEAEMGDIHTLGLDRKMEDITLASGETFTISAEGKFVMALYWGTESSRQAILDGFGLAESDVAAILQTMNREQLSLVNSTWRVNESMWPELSSAHVELYGVAPPKLTAMPFTVNGVELTGGHMRLFYDSTELELRSEEQNQPSFAGIMPNKAGSLHARVGSGGRPPLLDINNIVRSIEDNTHYIAFAKASAHLRRIVNHNDVKAAIEQKHGVGFYKAMIEAIEGITGNHMQRESIPMLALISRTLRRAATMKYLAYSVRNTVQQFSAIPIAMDEVGSVEWANQLVRYGSPNNHAKFVGFVNERSSFMTNRASLVNREAAEYLRKISVKGKAEHVWNLFSKFGFTPQTIVDSMVAYPTWMARYQHEIAQGSDEVRATSAADSAVAESVGSGSDLHLGSAFHMNNTELVKLFTVFGTWFNAYYNRMYRSTKGTMSPIASWEAFRATTILPALVAVLASALIYDGPDDDEAWLAWALKRYAAFMGGTIPLLRDVVSSFSGFAPKTVFSGGLEMPARAYSEVMSYSEDKQTGLKLTTDIAGAITSVIPVPGSGNFIRLMDYTESYQRGKEGDYDPLRGVIKGKSR